VTGRWALGLVTGLLFAGAVIAVVVVTGHYPRTGDGRLLIWVGVLVPAAVAVLGSARVFAALGSETRSNRLAASVFVGFVFGALAIGVLFIIGLTAFAILLSRAHLTGLAP
jgi:hypothetical protein